MHVAECCLPRLRMSPCPLSFPLSPLLSIPLSVQSRWSGLINRQHFLPLLRRCRKSNLPTAAAEPYLPLNRGNKEVLRFLLCSVPNIHPLRDSDVARSQIRRMSTGRLCDRLYKPGQPPGQGSGGHYKRGIHEEREI